MIIVEIAENIELNCFNVFYKDPDGSDAVVAQCYNNTYPQHFSFAEVKQYFDSKTLPSVVTKLDIEVNQHMYALSGSKECEPWDFEEIHEENIPYE